MSIHLNLSWSIKLLVVKVEYLAELQFIKSTTWDLTRRALCSLCRKWKKKRSPTPWFRTTVTGCFRMQWMKFGQQAEASEPYHLLLLFLKPTFWHPFNLQMIFSLLILNGEAEEILRCLTILGVVKCSCLSALNKSLHLSCSLWISISYFFFWCFEGREIKISSQKPGNGFSISFLKPFSQMLCGYPQLQLFALHSPDKDQARLFMPAPRSACGCSFLTLQGVIWVAVEPSCAACGGPELNAVLNNGICWNN